MTSENVIQVTDADFEEKVLKSDQPVLVDFWAEWCSPCKTIEPYFHELANEYGDKIRFARLDTGKNPSYAAQYGVRSMPTFIMFKNGQQAGLQIGANPNKIKQMVVNV